jgi:hypothetical protein
LAGRRQGTGSWHFIAYIMFIKEEGGGFSR